MTTFDPFWGRRFQREEGRMSDNDVVETWFRLRDWMLREGLPAEATTIRPPSLRDACYAWALAMRTIEGTTPETIEAFVNGLELGALDSLREAWKARGQ
jgi:hypothetical protein